MANPQVVLADAPPTGRVARRPSHHFNLETRPWQIQPICMAPVLPGETMKNLLLQSRVTSDPVNNALTGWWSEYYFFYVKLRDLDGRDDFAEMILTPSYDLSTYDAAADEKTYHAGPGIDWTTLALKRVVEEYFRDEGEAWDDFLIDGIPLCSINHSSWLDSIKLDSVTPADDHELPGENPSLPAHMTGWENHFAQWEHMRALEMTEATFEDWLATFGVTAPRAEKEIDHKPELLRYIRDWSYPRSGSDDTGAGTSLMQWSHSERADKDRFFKEPGFILGVSVVRPKVYLTGQAGSAIGMLNDAFSWLPAIMSDEPYTSLRKFQTSTSADGPLGDTPSADYWVDLRDLFLYGDQFVNYDLAAQSDVSKAALPATSLARRFASATDADNLFGGLSKTIRQDGVCSLNILGRQVDHT